MVSEGVIDFFYYTHLTPLKCFASVRSLRGLFPIRFFSKSSTLYHREQCSVPYRAVLRTYIEQCSVTSGTMLRSI